MAIDTMKTMVLLSGGIDSSTCIAHYFDKRHVVQAVFVDYGQKSVSQEKDAALAIAAHYSITCHIIRCTGIELSEGLIVGRNAFLLMNALMFSAGKPYIISIGIHDGTIYPDCTSAFVLTMQKAIDFYSNGIVQIDAPFISMSKHEVWLYAKKLRVPLELTYSCELGLRQPCGKCLSCKDLEVLNG